MNKDVGKHHAKFSTFPSMITNAYVEGGAQGVSDKAIAHGEEDLLYQNLIPDSIPVILVTINDYVVCFNLTDTV